MKLQYLDLSTSHLTQTTVQELDSGTFSGITVANYEYGVFVSVPGASGDIDELTAPEDLKRVLRFAREAGCDVVRFDADGDTEAELPRFDW